MSTPGNPSAFKPLTPRRKRSSIGPALFYVVAALFVLVGFYFLYNALIGPGKPISNMFATDTPTPTLTYTPTNTSTPTATSTETLTPTITNTPTPSAPFIYVIQEGDNLVLIAEKFQLADDGITLILGLNPAIEQNNGIIFPGQQLLIPNPDMRAPTATLLPGDIPRGTKLTYTVLPGDTLAGIAARFNSTVDAIMKENKIEDANALQAYQKLIVPVNMVTPTATRPPTSTPVTTTPTLAPTGTKAP
jgi:LysM repeat protein